MSRPVRLGAAAALALAFALGCEPKTAAPGATGAKDQGQEAARIGDQVITLGQLDDHVREQLFRQATEDGDPAKLYEVRTQALDELVEQRLVEAEAKARGMSSEDLLQLEERKAPPVTQADVQKLFDQFKNRLGPDAKVETYADQIRARLEAQAQAKARADFVASLREKANVVVALEPPRVKVAATGPSLGPENAPVTIVEFSDYECPFCKRAHPTLKKVLEKYPQQVRFVYRNFPLEMHKNARPAAEAALCAEEQGKFWAYHDLVFESTEPLSAETLRKLAEKAGLDLAKFDPCVKEQRFRAKIDADVADGREAKVSGTPAFFVNGIPLSGARSEKEFTDLIDQELKRGGEAAS